MLAVYIPVIIASVIGGAIGALFYIIAVVAWLGLILALISAAVRRLHDTGRSGWWYWIGLIPFIGGIWLLVLLVLDGDAGANQYGPNPAGGVSEPEALVAGTV